MARPEDVFLRADDPRLGEVVEFWRGDPAALTPGRAVLVGFPHDEGVRRNHGRVGAADAPRAIRHALYRLTSWDGARDVDLASHPPLDAGNVHALGTLEDTQGALGEVVWRILESGAVPVVLGGGHETAYGHYLGYVSALREVAILNLDAHLDVRPCPEGHGHSGSAFRQAMEHPALPLPASRYACLGAQPHSISREHVRFVQQGGGVVRWENEVRGSLLAHFAAEQGRLTRSGCPLYVTVDADVVSVAEVPGVSAPNALGLSGVEVAEFAYQAGRSAAVSSFDLVEINPRHDPDGRSTRWAATVVWHFLVGLAQRGGDRGTSKT